MKNENIVGLLETVGKILKFKSDHPEVVEAMKEHRRKEYEASINPGYNTCDHMVRGWE